MSKPFLWLMSVLITGWSTAAPASEAEAKDNLGKATFATCAACHLPTGQGIPGAFPSLRKLSAVAIQDGGKEYLISVVLQGLSGKITAGNAAFYGNMQGFATTFSDDQIAAVLNYVLSEIAEDASVYTEELSTAEVATVRMQLQAGELPASKELRQLLTMP